jgi:hypothetical protein
MANSPNSFRPVFTVFDRLNGQTYETSLAPVRVFDTEGEAIADGQHYVAEAGTYRDDGTIDGSAGFWHVRPMSFRVRAWFDEFRDRPPVFSTPWFGTEEAQEAWEQGPGREP